MNHEFANLTAGQKFYIENAGIGDCIITAEQIHQATEILELEGKSNFELIAIRNSVVRYLGNIKTDARENNDWELYDKAANNMSGITCAIDNLIYS